MTDYTFEYKHIFSEEIERKLHHWVKKYPKDQKQSAVIPGLHILQDHYDGYLTVEIMDQLAAYLEMPNIAVYEVASFYSMYDLKKVARHKLNVCTNISCLLNGSGDIVKHIESRLGIKLGETTEDGRITFRQVECQGACCGAPMLEVDKKFYENLTFDKVDQILDSLE
ncbi:NAD(P)H-dependent oxidoreductase subunit E [Thiotrichales bacterium 19S11-10]|nr:NAD(P)H-dependent oxidoreductase subunit E [Thiotrichales bacterium 19S11-10]MCF6806970.1 NAD(P)H-dependent oxidoreductase subunit E [Thiotrichales bacterium 19S9-11]MCF6810939.1 NAD(P)H-dependent oxidoreductase subunit E [Thiotrichales bacterium 19S9-12]